MHGKKQRFTVSDISLTLARPTLKEMTAIEGKLRDLLGEPDASEFSGNIDEILYMAVADEADADREAFDKLADLGDRLELWDAWVEFSEVKRFLFSRAAKKLEYIKSERRAQYLAAGLTEQQADDLMSITMMPSQSSTSST